MDRLTNQEVKERFLALEGQQAALGTICAMLLAEVARLAPDQQTKLDQLTARLRVLAEVSAHDRPQAISTRALTAFVEGAVTMAERLLQQPVSRP